MDEYWNLFWATGMPEAWTMSRRAGDDPQADKAAQAWPIAMLDQRLTPSGYGPLNVVPGDNGGRPVPTPEDDKTKR